MNQSETAPVLVTGATGFVGTHLTRELLRRGKRVRVFGRDLYSLRLLADMGAEAFPGDLGDADAVLAACRGARLVIHAGAFSAPWGDEAEFERVDESRF